ncbi:unnamed protein product [Notodromas monacha]|uniref:Peptidase S1 domain-containing protein n=1 Tax=Notodromas monacha TaxID=399045 RepID=A0A7R9BN57_9CRUS|nr:unnamed protein product [Notodromas monacha]CAG0917714.1 unnamed protein product [Notodromas monacha]
MLARHLPSLESHLRRAATSSVQDSEWLTPAAPRAVRDKELATLARFIKKLRTQQCTNVVDGATADGTHGRHRGSDNYAGHMMRQASSPADDEGDTPVIINGQKVANRNLAPWMVYLEALNSGICGGSLITNQVILTAAHCVTSKDATTGVLTKASSVSYTIGGLTSLSGDESAETGEFTGTQTANGIKVHEQYTESDLRYDLALVKLATPIAATTSTISPITLAAPDFNAEGLGVTVIGWGVTQTGDVSADLLSAATDVRSNAVCESYWNCPGQTANYDSGFQLCFSGHGINGVCSGDSGGPVVTQLGSSAVQLAVNSFVRPGTADAGPCPVVTNKSKMSAAFLQFFRAIFGTGTRAASECGINTPAVGPKIAAHRNWIDTNAANLAA